MEHPFVISGHLAASILKRNQVKFMVPKDFSVIILGSNNEEIDKWTKYALIPFIVIVLCLIYMAIFSRTFASVATVLCVITALVVFIKSNGHKIPPSSRVVEISDKGIDIRANGEVENYSPGLVKEIKYFISRESNMLKGQIFAVTKEEKEVELVTISNDVKFNLVGDLELVKDYFMQVLKEPRRKMPES